MEPPDGGRPHTAILGTKLSDLKQLLAAQESKECRFPVSNFWVRTCQRRREGVVPLLEGKPVAWQVAVHSSLAIRVAAAQAETLNLLGWAGKAPLAGAHGNPVAA